MVWRESFPLGRKIFLDPFQSIDKKKYAKRRYSYYNLPVTLYVCCQSRYKTLLHYNIHNYVRYNRSTWSSQNPPRPSPYRFAFNPQRDAGLFTLRSLWFSSWYDEKQEKNNPGVFSTIKRLIIKDNSSHSAHPGSQKIILSILGKCLGYGANIQCEKIIFDTVHSKHYPPEDPRNKWKEGVMNLFRKQIEKRAEGSDYGVPKIVIDRSRCHCGCQSSATSSS